MKKLYFLLLAFSLAGAVNATVAVVDPVADVTVHFPNDVGFNAPIIPPLDLAIGHLLLFKNSLT